jgi:hypothetical protein
MGLVTINLPDEVKDKLKKENNQSGLITQLLLNHYKYNNSSMSEIDHKIKEITDRQREQVDLMNKDIDKLLSIKQYQQNIQQQAKMQEDKIKEKESSKRLSRNKYFRDETGRDMTDDEYIEFDKQWSEGKLNIVEFAQSKKQ